MSGSKSWFSFRRRSYGNELGNGWTDFHHTICGRPVIQYSFSNNGVSDLEKVLERTSFIWNSSEYSSVFYFNKSLTNYRAARGIYKIILSAHNLLGSNSKTKIKRINDKLHFISLANFKRFWNKLSKSQRHKSSLLVQDNHIEWKSTYIFSPLMWLPWKVGFIPSYWFSWAIDLFLLLESSIFDSDKQNLELDLLGRSGHESSGFNV